MDWNIAKRGRGDPNPEGFFFFTPIEIIEGSWQPKPRRRGCLADSAEQHWSIIFPCHLQKWLDGQEHVIVPQVCILQFSYSAKEMSGWKGGSCSNWQADLFGDASRKIRWQVINGAPLDQDPDSQSRKEGRKEVDPCTAPARASDGIGSFSAAACCSGSSELTPVCQCLCSRVLSIMSLSKWL